jgi:NADPH:quinone reductase-like Zn-dependent oxidoreductase
LKSVLVTKPANVTFEQAASAPIAALTALQGLRDKGKIQPGQKVPSIRSWTESVPFIC